ncbi:MAG TPA: LysR family transcriptional regulator substrate-binding protein, partial [Terriglobales bacterium]|nr:LysR family transcriptional regulator substrate-binding protein [Terriglobales bacterium]
ANHLRPQLAAKAAQLVTIARMVGSGLGVTLVPQMMAKSDFTSGCVALPFAPPVPVRQLNMLRNPLRLESRAAAAFREETATAFTA